MARELTANCLGLISQLINKVEEHKDNLIKLKKESQVAANENRFLQTQNTELNKKIEILEEQTKNIKPKSTKEKEQAEEAVDSAAVKKLEKDNQFLLKKLYDLHKKFTKVEK